MNNQQKNSTNVMSNSAINVPTNLNWQRMECGASYAIDNGTLYVWYKNNYITPSGHFQRDLDQNPIDTICFCADDANYKKSKDFLNTFALRNELPYLMFNYAGPRIHFATDKNSLLRIENGLLFNGDDLIMCLEPKQKVEIPEGTKTICPNAFAGCVSLQSAVLPNSLSTIGHNAFANCTNLKEVKLPVGLRVICHNAFSECSSIEHIEIPSTTMEVEMGAFSPCKNLRSIKVEASNKWLRDIDGVLYNKKEKMLIAYPAAKEGQEFEVPEKVELICSQAFCGCQNLTKITIPDDVEEIGMGAFFGCTALTDITLPEDLEFLEESTFGECSSLTHIKIPDMVSEIQDTVFYRCSSLTDVYIPNYVNILCSNTFAECTSLRNIKVDAQNQYFCDHDGILYTKDNSVLVCYPAARDASVFEIPQGVEVIDSHAFCACQNLTGVKIPQSLACIEMDAFNSNAKLRSIEVDASNGRYCDFDGVLYDKSNHSIVTYPAAREDKTYEIVRSTKRIAEYAFNRCTNLNTIKIPSSVNEIEDYAFDECANLVNLAIPASVKKVEAKAFCGCHNLKYVAISSGTIYDSRTFHDSPNVDIISY